MEVSWNGGTPPRVTFVCDWDMTSGLAPSTGMCILGMAVLGISPSVCMAHEPTYGGFSIINQTVWGSPIYGTPYIMFWLYPH